MTRIKTKYETLENHGFHIAVYLDSLLYFIMANGKSNKYITKKPKMN